MLPLKPSFDNTTNDKIGLFSVKFLHHIDTFSENNKFGTEAQGVIIMNGR